MGVGAEMPGQNGNITVVKMSRERKDIKTYLTSASLRMKLTRRGGKKEETEAKTQAKRREERQAEAGTLSEAAAMAEDMSRMCASVAQ